MKVSIFSYDDYRRFLRDLVAQQKKSRAAFSHRFFARQAGFSSSAVLKLVMDGKRNLTLESATRFAQAFHLNKQETEFFLNLVLLNQASSQSERARHMENLIASRPVGDLRTLEKNQFRYYSRWYYSAIRELVLLRDFREDPEWIAKRLRPPIPAAEARKALDLLLKLGLLRREESGKLVQASPTITSGHDVRSAALVSFHHQMMERARESMESLPSAEREISAVTLALPAGKIGPLKEMIREFRRKLMTLDSGAGVIPEQVYQVNIQLFPLTQHKGVKS